MKREDCVSVEEFGRSTWLEIDLACVRGNYHVIRGMVPAKTHVLCVVKDDAYGHGAVDVARVLQEEGAHWFALATLEEALELRRAGIKAVSYTHLRAHETRHDLVCRLLLEKKKKKKEK